MGAQLLLCCFDRQKEHERQQEEEQQQRWRALVQAVWRGVGEGCFRPGCCHWLHPVSSNELTLYLLNKITVKNKVLTMMPEQDLAGLVAG
jgi:hypothetical protein